MKPKLFLIAVTACMIVACNSPIKNGDSVHLSIKNTTNVSFNKNNSLSCTTGNKTPFIISIDKNNKIQLSTEFGDNLYLENYYVNISKNKNATLFSLDTIEGDYYLKTENNYYLDCNGSEIYETEKPTILIRK